MPLIYVVIHTATLVNFINSLAEHCSMYILKQELHKVFEVLMGQLRQLLGLKSDDLYVGESGTSILLGSERGFTEW
jgi:phosphatidylinositol glycan class S